MHVHRAVVAGVGIAPHKIHQRLPAVDPPGVFHQQLQQVVFLGGQVDGPAVPDGHPLLGVQTQIPHRQQRPGRVGPARAALEQRPDAGLQLKNVEGLGHIVVCPAGEAHQLVGILAAGRQHDDGHIGKLPDLHARLRAGQHRHHQIENDQVEVVLLRQFHGGVPIIGGGDFISLVLQIERDSLHQQLLVIHH